MGGTPTNALQQQSEIGSVSSQGMTPMLSPDGKPGQIPTHRVPEALKDGFKLGALLTSPGGGRGVVPLDKVHAAIGDGFTPYVPTEAQAAARPAVAPPVESQRVAGTTLKSPLDPTAPAEGDILAAPVMPAAATAGQVASIGGSKLGEYIGEKTKMTPAETIWASRIGGVLGVFSGAGAAAQAESIWGGLKSGLASKLYTSEGELSKLGESLVHPTKLPENALRTIFPPNPEPGAGGAPLPSSAEFYENKAADFVRRGREQATLDAKSARKAAASARDASKYYQSGAGQSSAPAAVGQLPPVAPVAGPAPAAMGEGATTSTGPAAAITTPGTPTPAAPAPSPIVSPGSAPAPIKGSFWSYNEGALRQAVLAGDREAAVVYRMRFNTLPSNARYLTDVTDSIIKGLYKGSK